MRATITPRQATFAAFLAFGMSVGLWSGSVPTVVARAGIGAAGLGAATTGFIACSIAGVAAAGLVARHVAIRHTLIAILLLTGLGCAAALSAASPVAFVVLFLAFGFAGGLCDGTMNAEGTAVERDAGRPVLAGFHAAASFAAAVSAGIGGALSVWVGTGATAALALAAALTGAAVVTRATPLRPVEVRRSAAGPARGIGRPILLLGLIAGISMAGEASALMFAASTLREQAPQLAAYAGLGVTAFGLCQALTRARIDRLRRRFSDADIILWSIGLSTCGFVIVATGSGALQSAIGFAVIGIGTAAIVPCSFALAPRLSGLGAAQAIGLLSLVSALPRVPQPLGFGEIAGAWGFAAAYGLNAVLMTAAVALFLALRRSAALPA